MERSAGVPGGRSRSADRTRRGAARVELDPALPPVRMAGRVLNELYAHAREAFPEECCGLVAGTPGDRHRMVYRCRNEMERRHRLDPETFPRDAREGFYMNELDYQRASRDASAWSGRITAVYHSHVGFGVYLSDLDLEFAGGGLFPFPRADQIVISVLEGRVDEVGLFARDAGGGFRAGRRVRAELS